MNIISTYTQRFVAAIIALAAFKKYDFHYSRKSKSNVYKYKCIAQ